MSIWHESLDMNNLPLAQLTSQGINKHLAIKITEIGDDFLRGTIPVDERTQQPYGLLHGGASVVLAETLGSVAAALCIDMSRYNCVGLEVNANHLRGVSDGLVTGTARPIHIGRRTQVWGIDLQDEMEKKTCVCRLTVAVIEQ